MEKAKVYFTPELTPEAVVRMYEALDIQLPGKVAVKVHSGAFAMRVIDFSVGY